MIVATQTAAGESPRRVSAPRRALPAGAWDCHAHVFGPFDRFPLAPECRYQPPFAPVEAYRDMLDAAGFSSGVLVHASAAAFDNRGTAYALEAMRGRAVGVAVMPTTVSDDELAKTHGQGFRAIRYTENGFGPRGAAQPGVQTLENLRTFHPRLKALGWHAHIWAKCAYIVEMADELAAMNIPIVLDHMGYFEHGLGVEDALFRSLVERVRTHGFYIKLTPGRIDSGYPKHEAVRAFHDALISAAPDQVLFGSDWPYIGQYADVPDVGMMIDLFDDWTRDDAVRQKVFVDNPNRLFASAKISA